MQSASHKEVALTPEVVALAWLRSVLSRRIPLDDVKLQAGAFDAGVRRDWEADVRRVAAMAAGRGIKTPPLLRLMNIEAISASIVEEARIVVEELAAEITADAQSAKKLVAKSGVIETKENSKELRGMSVQQANTKAMKLADADPMFLTRPIRVWADKIGCSISTAQKTKLWKETMRTTGRGRSRGSSPKVVSMTGELEATIGDGGRHEVLNELIAEQNRDFEPSPLHTVTSRKMQRVHKRL